VIDFELQSRLPCSRERAWAWISSVAGISAEMRPYFRMTAPPGVERLDDVKVELGKPLFRSRVFVFDLIPAGHWDLTLVELDPGRGFVERSPSSSMRSWRHERRILDRDGGVELRDHLTFEPRFAAGPTGAFIRHVFRHRHAVLQARLST
jgi:ligand-binding SRPBCC domain-containing protein